MSTGDTDKLDPGIDPGVEEPVEQQEYRKKLQDRIQEAQARRSGERVAEDEPEDHAPPVKEWKPPEEARMTAETGRLLGRLLVFAILVFGIYLVVQQIIGVYYAPDLQALGPVYPSERVMPGTPTRVGVLTRNTSRMEGAAFVVAAFQDGEEIEGTSTPIPPGDTATVWVDVPFPSGDQIFALILFDGWRDVERVTTYPGLRVEVGEHLVEIGDVNVPETVSAGDSLTIGLSATNTGQYPEDVRAVVQLSSRTGERPAQFEGEIVQIPTGESAEMQIRVDTGSLEPGSYTADVFVVTAEGRRIAGIESPIPLEIAG